jgi:hypothetical protein
MIPCLPGVSLTAMVALAGFCLLGRADFARAQTIYKCVDAAGAVVYQDHACKAGMTETRQEITPPAPATSAPISFDKLPTPLSTPAPPPPPPTPPPVAAKPPVPPIWFCTRPDDDTHYVSRDGQPATRWVPAGIVGIPQRGLAQTYGPGGGAGVSAPGVNAPKPLRGPGDRMAGGYVEVNDECVQASELQACDYFHDELDAVDKKLRKAFKDEQAVLEPQQAQLRHDLEGC